MDKKEFISKWLESIQGNIWKNEEILAFQIAEGLEQDKIDATKHAIEQDQKSYDFISKRNEANN